MYRRFFGLKKAPFKITPDSELFFEYADRHQIVDALVYSIQRGDPIIKVVGDVGCGKTTILRQVLKQISNTKLRLIHIYSPNLTSKDLLFLLCSELQISVQGDEEKYKIMKLIEETLLQLNQQGQRVVVLIDEAQAMPVDTLEELRMLSNLETETEKLLQIVLFGQPELDKTLQMPQLRQLQSRVAYEIYLKPLDCKEVWHYLNYRMQRAGYTGDPVFSKKIACKIQKITQGLPREINLLADKLLITAFSHQDESIKDKHLKEVGYKDKNTLFTITISIVLLLAVGVAVYFYMQNYHSQRLAKVLTVLGLKQSEQHETQEKNKADTATLPKSTDPQKQKPTKEQATEQTIEQVTESDQSESLNPENAQLKKFAQVLNLSIDKAEPVYKLYQQSHSQIKEMLKYQYTIQLMVGRVETLNETYHQIKKWLPKPMRAQLIPLIDVQEKHFILVLGYGNEFSKLKKMIQQLRPELKRYAPYVMMMSKYQKIVTQTEQLLRKQSF